MSFLRHITDNDTLDAVRTPALENMLKSLKLLAQIATIFGQDHRIPAFGAEPSFPFHFNSSLT
jgi:hypothetical protein